MTEMIGWGCLWISAIQVDNECLYSLTVDLEGSIVDEKAGTVTKSLKIARFVLLLTPHQSLSAEFVTDLFSFIRSYWFCHN